MRSEGCSLKVGQESYRFSAASVGCAEYSLRGALSLMKSETGLPPVLHIDACEREFLVAHVQSAKRPSMSHAHLFGWRLHRQAGMTARSGTHGLRSVARPASQHDRDGCERFEPARALQEPGKIS